MIQNFTLSDYIRYAYNETELPETVLIQKSIDNNPDTEEMYSEIVETMSFLDKLKINPSKKSIQKILSYSREGNVLASL